MYTVCEVSLPKVMVLNTAGVITQTEYDAHWDAAIAAEEVDWQWIDGERQRAIPKSLGRGQQRVIDLLPGLSLSIHNVWYRRPLCLDYHCTSGDVLLSNFYLAGDRRMVNPGIQLEADREEAAGETCLCYIEAARSIEYFPAEQTLQSLSISVELERLRSLAQTTELTFPLLQRLIEDTAPQSFHVSLRHTTTAMQQTLYQILHCPHRGLVKRLYLESKTLELLTLQFDQLTEPPPESKALTLRPADLERLHQARDILQCRFAEPPSLLALARQVGLNDYKLKQGFRQVFATTPFGYLRQQRLQQAQRLLQETDMAIEQVAATVGYQSRSSFAAAFRRQFGQSPKAWQQRHR